MDKHTHLKKVVAETSWRMIHWYVFLYNIVCFWRSVPVAASSKSVQDLCQNGIFGVLPHRSAMFTEDRLTLLSATPVKCHAHFHQRIFRAARKSQDFWSTIFPLDIFGCLTPSFHSISKAAESSCSETSRIIPHDCRPSFVITLVVLFRGRFLSKSGS